MLCRSFIIARYQANKDNQRPNENKDQYVNEDPDENDETEESSDSDEEDLISVQTENDY